MPGLARLTRNAHRWLPGLVAAHGRAARANARFLDGPLDLYVTVCDHFEPFAEGASEAVADERVQQWAAALADIAPRCPDSDGRGYQHGLFTPIELWWPTHLEVLAGLCHAGLGDVEIHLHHSGGSPAELADRLTQAARELSDRFGLLHQDESGRPRYAFIHGDWALANSAPGGRSCGVDGELAVLVETGCYADFTNPSAPAPTQPHLVNAIYYATDGPTGRRGHDTGILAQRGCEPPEGHLLLIQGPLALDWGKRKWGVLPRVDNASLHAGFLADEHRVRRWVAAGVGVVGHPDQRFVKLHTHGCRPRNIDALLDGGPDGGLVGLHRSLAAFCAAHDGARFHWLTPWETAQKVHELERASRTAST